MNDPAAGQASVKVVRPRRLAWHQKLAAECVYWMVRLVAATIRFRCEDRSGGLVRSGDRALIFCIWHDRLALCMEVWRRYIKTPRGGLAAMVSASKDGGILARVLERFGVEPVRGSTSRRGRQALLELTSWAERGFDLAITPDGPRGPRHVVQPGVIYLAQVTGMKIVPVTYEFSPKVTLKSWDRFMVPLPFCRCSVVLGAAVQVDRQAGESEQEKARVELEAGLNGEDWKTQPG